MEICEQFDYQLAVVEQIQVVQLRNPLFFGIHPELFSYIESTFKHYIFLAPNLRLSAVIFWQSYRDNFWSEEIKLKSQKLEAGREGKFPKVSLKTKVESSEGTSYFDT